MSSYNGMQRWFNPRWEGLFLGWVPTHHCEHCGYLLMCSDNLSVENEQRLGTRRADHVLPLNWLDDRSPLSAATEHEARSLAVIATRL